MKLDMPKVVLILGLSTLLAGVCVWLIATGRMPAAALSTPVVGILSAVAAYLKGREDTPTWMTDPVKLRAARSIAPPALPSLDPVPVVIDEEPRQ